MTETNDFQASDLEQTILINEEIKRIVSSSAEIRLAAINASRPRMAVTWRQRWARSQYKSKKR